MPAVSFLLWSMLLSSMCARTCTHWELVARQRRRERRQSCVLCISYGHGSAVPVLYTALYIITFSLIPPCVRLFATDRAHTASCLPCLGIRSQHARLCALIYNPLYIVLSFGVCADLRSALCTAHNKRSACVELNCAALQKSRAENVTMLFVSVIL